MVRKFLSHTDKIEETLSVLLFLALVVLCFMQVLFRFFLNFSLSWTEELANYDFILLIYVSCSLAILRGAHVRVEIIDALVTGVAKYVLDQILDLIWTIFIFAVGYYGIGIMRDAFLVEKTTPALDWPYGAVYAIVPATFFLMTVRLLQRMVQRHRAWVTNHENI
ncbi:TRAP transporter small permease [Consotaella salsifontis]|uniref:TRAP transporter small permease protein n=1 Tax=Consotaella salsifontis TaxID=1365950 RepID=A0A1T4MGF6_9HYPH|nr:TRAP transporter small permease [Consotaella salsifontis]SJZ66170.1 TRAP-type C4-dicarboxylate transport system, small permease component [Consotaella salsifontis]